MDMGAYGSVTNSIYAESDGGSGYTMYLFDGSSWASQAATEDDLAMYDVSGSIDGYIDSVTAFSQTGEEQVDGVDTYKYTGAISGEAMENVVKESGALDSLGDLGLDESQMNEMLSGLGDISVSLWISKDDPYPASDPDRVWTPGAKVLVIAARGDDGRITARRVAVGKDGLTPPM